MTQIRILQQFYKNTQTREYCVQSLVIVVFFFLQSLIHSRFQWKHVEYSEYGFRVISPSYTRGAEIPEAISCGGA